MATGMWGKRKDVVLTPLPTKGSIPVIAGFNLTPRSYWKQVVHKDRVQASV